MKVGVGLKPGTKVDVVTEWVDQGLVDMVLVMTVEPGFGGQSFMEGMMSKVEALRKAYPTLDIEVIYVCTCISITLLILNVIIIDRLMGESDLKQLMPVQLQELT